MPVPLTIPLVPGILGPPQGSSEEFKYLIVREVSRVTASLVLEVKRSDGVLFVAKMIFFDTSPRSGNDANGGGGQSIERVEREIRCLRRCSHFACLGLVDSYILSDDKIVILILELCTAGSLADQIDHFGKTGLRFSEIDICTWFLFLVQGLHHIHSQNMLHRDLKPPNILLHTNGLLKIADFGLSNVYEETVTSSNVGQTICGTPNYLAPELWERKPYSARADMYSLGVVLYELMEFTTPFASSSISELHTRVLSGNPPRPMANIGNLPVSSHLQHWIRRLLSRTPEHRPTTLELMQSPLLLSHCATLLRMLYERENMFGPLATHVVVKELIRSLHEAQSSPTDAAANPPSLNSSLNSSYNVQSSTLPPLPDFQSREDFFTNTFAYIDAHFSVDTTVSYRGYVEKFKQSENCFEKRYMMLENGFLHVRRSPPPSAKTTATTTASSTSSSSLVETVDPSTSSSTAATAAAGIPGAASSHSSDRNIDTNNNNNSVMSDQGMPAGGSSCGSPTHASTTTTSKPKKEGGSSKALSLSLIVNANLYGTVADTTTAAVQTCVFCFLTEDGVSTFFQAATQQEAYEWVWHIQKAKRKLGFVS